MKGKNKKRKQLCVALGYRNYLMKQKKINVR